MAAYWLDRYDLVLSDNTRVTGAGYTDINAILPAKNILVWIAFVVRPAVLRERVPAHLAAAGARPRAC